MLENHSKNQEQFKNGDEMTRRLEFEAKQNLLGFFNLLLEIDKRIDPHLYKNNENNRDTNTPN